MQIKNKYFADFGYYKKVLKLVIPMILQAGVTNFVSLLDNIMVGQVGTSQMSGVAIVNQYIFIVNITIFGLVSGSGIFGAQFFGKGDAEGHKYSVRYRVLSVAVLTAVSCAVLLVFKKPLIRLFLKGDDSPALVEETLSHGVEYLDAVILSLIPFAAGQAYASAVKECGRTYVPMLASVTAVVVNLVFDYGLIFGKLGMPEMGVTGAAIATVIAKIVEAAIIIGWAHRHPDLNPYIPGLYQSLHIPRGLFWGITRKSIPLMINEFLWSLGVSVVAQCYSVRGLNVVAARNIYSTVNNMFNVIYIQMGVGIGILLGQLLGAGRFEEAKLRKTHLMNFCVAISVVTALVQIPVAFLFPGIYNTENTIKALATYFILIESVLSPVYSYTNACYFVLRSGGQTGITLFFDIFFTWVIMIPTAALLCYGTNMDIHPLFAIVMATELIKMVIGHFLMKTGTWVRRIID